MQRIKATIKYSTKNNHPDVKNAKDLVFTDIYTIDQRCFYGPDDISDYIKEDLSLVAGGGYNTNTIDNINFELINIGGN
jgi:hypothetical protein